MKLINGKVVPDFVMKKVVEDVIDGQEVVRLELVRVHSEEGKLFIKTTRPTRESGPDGTAVLEERRIQLTNSFFRFCKNERDLAASATREFFESTIMVSKIWWDGKYWKAERFQRHEYEDLVKRALEQGCIPQYGKAKWPTGGGRSAQSAGCFFYATADKGDVIAKLYRETLKVNPERMSSREKVARTSILFAPATRLSERPTIKLSQTDLMGFVLVSEEYAAKVGIHRGDKMWPIKASAEIVPSHIHMEADMVIPPDAIKFVDHAENTQVLSELMSIIPGLTAKERCSEEKGRVPKLALDTMQWLHPGIQTVIREDDKVMERLALVKRVVEGTASLEETLSLGEYTDPKTGTKKYPMEFEFLQKGQPIEERMIRAGVFKAAASAAFKAITFRVGGAYGVAMPLTGEAKRKRLALCPPWMLPFWVETQIGGDVMSVDSSWLVECLQKDFDGDMLIVQDMRRIHEKVGPMYTFPDWTKSVACCQDKACLHCKGSGLRFPDREWAANWLKLPEKSKVNDGRSVHQVMVDGLEGYGLIGRATNACMIVLDTLRLKGNLSRADLMGTYLHMMSTEVQKYVDALKYVPGGLKFYGLKGISKSYGVDSKLSAKLALYFKAVRSMDFDELVALPDDPELEGSFYYQLSRLFKGWKPMPSVDMKEVAAKVLLTYPSTEPMEGARGRSYRMHQKDVALRVKEVIHLIGNRKAAVAMAAQCWLKNDVSLAVALEQVAGVRILDVFREPITNGGQPVTPAVPA